MMVTLELVEATMLERAELAAKIEREHKAVKELGRRSAAPRSAPSHGPKRLRLPAFIARAFRVPSAS